MCEYEGVYVWRALLDLKILREKYIIYKYDLRVFLREFYLGDIYGSLWGISGKLFGKFGEVFGKSLGSLWEVWETLWGITWADK